MKHPNYISHSSIRGMMNDSFDTSALLSVGQVKTGKFFYILMSRKILNAFEMPPDFMTMSFYILNYCLKSILMKSEHSSMQLLLDCVHFAGSHS